MRGAPPTPTWKRNDALVGCEWDFWSIVIFALEHDDRNMNTLRKPRIGDHVRIDGFLGVFEVVRIERNGMMVDLKHLGRPGSDYIEKEILTRELKYLDSPRPVSAATASGTRHVNGGWSALGAAANGKSTVNI